MLLFGACVYWIRNAVTNRPVIHNQSFVTKIAKQIRNLELYSWLLNGSVSLSVSLPLLFYMGLNQMRHCPNSLSLKCVAQSSSVCSNWLLTPAWWIILSLFIPIKCDCLRAGVTFRLIHGPVFCPSSSCPPPPPSSSHSTLLPRSLLSKAHIPSLTV